MLALLAAVVVTAGILVSVALVQLQREIPQTVDQCRRFGTHVRPALVRVREDTVAARARLDRAR